MTRTQLMRRIGLLAIVAIMLGLVGSLAAHRVAASGPTVISDANNNFAPAMAVSPAGDRICVVWAKYNMPGDAFLRLYTIGSGNWSPPLSAPPVNVSGNPDSTTSGPRCAIDNQGSTHVVWAEGGQKVLQHRRLAPNADPTAGGNWVPPLSAAPTALGTAPDAQAEDLAPLFAGGDGKVWLAYTASNGCDGCGYDIRVQSWSPATGWGGETKVSDASKRTAHYPRIGVDDAGFVHIAWWQSGFGIGYSYLDPRTGSWSSPVQVPGSSSALQYIGLAVNRSAGDVHISYLNYVCCDPAVYSLNYVKKSGPTGIFSGPVEVAGRANYQKTRLAWSPTGRVIVIADRGRPNFSLTYNTSDNNGASWNGETTLPDTGTVETPWVVADNGGTAYVAYWYGPSIGFMILPPPGGSPPPPPPTPTPTPTPPPAPVIPGATPEQCFSQTGKCTRGIFLDYWHAHGGLAINGYPISDPFTQTLEDGKPYLVQYFERVRMEYHPENAGTQYEVLLGQFGRHFHPADPAVAAQAGMTYFDVTGHNVNATFMAYWQANGGLAQFGFPLSELITEQLEDGKSYQVQYFERARFELHPENAPPNDVELGQFGRRILSER